MKRFIVDIVILCKSTHLYLTSVEARKNRTLFQLCSKYELFFADSPVRTRAKMTKIRIYYPAIKKLNGWLVILDPSTT